VTEVATALTLGVVAASQPGTFQAFLLARSVRDGWRRTLPLALAPLLSDGPIAAVALLVLSQAPAGWLRALAGAGGAFALLLAWEAGRSLRDELRLRASGHGRPPHPERTDVRGGVVRAALVNLLNPGPWLFWALVLGPLAIQAGRASPLSAALVVGSFYLALIGGFAALIVAFAAAARLGVRVRLGLQAASVVALAAFGVVLIGRAVLG
jgi:threonine/homoserine/homoserine lactone efflux protein